MFFYIYSVFFFLFSGYHHCLPKSGSHQSLLKFVKSSINLEHIGFAKVFVTLPLTQVVKSNSDKISESVLRYVKVFEERIFANKSETFDFTDFTDFTVKKSFFLLNINHV